MAPSDPDDALLRAVHDARTTAVQGAGRADRPASADASLAAVWEAIVRRLDLDLDVDLDVGFGLGVDLETGTDR
jgi:hypothetical protein